MVRGKNYKVHRIIYEMFNGFCPKVIDHINGDKLDNRIENLRGCDSNKINLENTSVYSNNKLGVKGVRKHGNKYTAQITHNSKQHYLGMFTTIKEASRAYEKAREELFETPNRR